MECGEPEDREGELCCRDFQRGVRGGGDYEGGGLFNREKKKVYRWRKWHTCKHVYIDGHPATWLWVCMCFKLWTLHHSHLIIIP